MRFTNNRLTGLQTDNCSKKCEMNKPDPFYCEGLKRGHSFWCLTFWGAELAFCSKKCDMKKCDPLGVTFFGVALFRVKWVVMGVGVRWVEGVDVHA